MCRPVDSFPSSRLVKVKVPVRVRHVAIGESNKELAKQNLCILAILAQSIKMFIFSVNCSN